VKTRVSCGFCKGCGKVLAPLRRPDRPRPEGVIGRAIWDAQFGTAYGTARCDWCGGTGELELFDIGDLFGPEPSPSVNQQGEG
jgi:hypothetical protein